MDGYKDATPAMMCVGGLCGLAFCAASVAFMVYTGIYAFNNPEPQAYFLEPTVGHGAQLVATADVDADGVVPIHDQFVLWFTWMFYNQAAFFGLMTFAPICMKMELTICVRIGFFLFQCSCFAIYVMGLVWRYGQAG